ncbi:MAG: YaeQ family protein [Bacteroidales bacterium]|nr:YaeQ family protein [Bacteroidales bacterium]
MALKATIYKATLNIADMDRHYYGTHSLTIACHPSETEERLMVRLLAFALFASDGLAFTRGISTDDEPDLWDRDLTGHITHWIELGVPDESRVRKGCNRADKMTVLSYGPRTASVWWEKNQGKLARQEKLQVLYLDKDTSDSLTALVSRNMDIQITIQDGQVWLSNNIHTAHFSPEIWKSLPA